MKFTKMHGCANDYVVLDAWQGELAERYAGRPPEYAAKLAAAMADRRRGVGADGFVLILPETRESSPADYEMRMYNPDGSYSPMCGNALRCVAKRLVDTGEVTGDTVVARSGETLVPMRVTERNNAGLATEVEADLGAPIFQPADIPCLLEPGVEGDLREVTFEAGNEAIDAAVLSMGNPHCVVFVDDPTDEMVHGLGPEIEYHEAFPHQTNVEFVSVESRTRLRQRTWERGVGETWACGSGACAVAVASALTGRTERRVTVELLGGELQLDWRESDGHVLMTGPAVSVYEGAWSC